jgi:intein-encoded DNA endonuclease-like protein
MLPIMLKSNIAYSDFSRDPLTSLKRTDKTERVNIQTTKTPIRPDRRDLPSGACLPAGGNSILLSGDVLRGPRPPGKAMAEKVMVEDPGPRGEGHTPQGQEQGGRSCLPRELRIKLYDEVNRLRVNGLTYNKIIEEIQRRYGVRLSKSHISYWMRGIHNPYNGRYIPSIEFLRPSEELAYVIGVKIGDGYTSRKKRVIKGYNRVRIGLEVKDWELAAEFGRCLAEILGRQTIKPRRKKPSGRYVVEVQSRTLYELLKKPIELERLKKYIEHCERCTAAFLRGFADSEGSINEEGYIRIHNTDYRLLEYVKELLKRFGIESTGPWTKRQQGKTFYDHKKMKRYTYKKECFHIYIRAGSNVNFYKNIGFTIERKQKRLENYVRRRQPNPLPLHFPSVYNYKYNYIQYIFMPRAGLEPATLRSSAGRAPSLRYRGLL